MGNLCSCMKPKRWRWRGDENHSQADGQHQRHQKQTKDHDGAMSNGTSSPNSHRTSNTNTKTQHIKDRELPPDDEHLINPADIPTVQPKFVKIVDQWASRSSGGGGGDKDSNLHINQRARESSLGINGEKKKKYEMSSTSNIHLDDSTVSKPNLKAMLKCLALAIYFHINKKRKDDYHDEEDEEDNIPEIFDERIYPLSKDQQKRNDDEIRAPDHKEVYKFVRTLFVQAQLASEVVMVTLIYLERLLTYAEFGFQATNWKRLTLGAIMLASKVWDDQAVWNVDFCMIINANVDDLNTLERSFLEILQFNVNVPGSVYAKYYFDLREMAHKYGMHFPRPILTKERATKLEASSTLKTKAKFKAPKTTYSLPPFKRSFSLDFQRNGTFDQSRMGFFKYQNDNLDDLKNPPVKKMPLVSDAIPEPGTAPKVPSKEERENPTIYNGPDPNQLRNIFPNLPVFSLFSNHMAMVGGDSMTSYESKEYNFGSLKPGATVRDVHSHLDNPTGASKCWKEKFALMMCARELNSEVATTGPCAEEAYWWARCRINGDTDMHRNMKIIYANAFFGDWGDAYKAQAYENTYGWNKFGFSGQKGGIPNPGRYYYHQ